jgi:hypothetical protein
MFDVKKVGIMSSAFICNGRQGRQLFERPWRDSTKKGGPGVTVLASKPDNTQEQDSLKTIQLLG